jgi:hypothetical protein
MFSRQVVAACQQVRSGFLSAQLTRDPALTPSQLAAAWDASDEAMACVRLIRAAKGALTAAQQLRSGLQSGQKGSKAKPLE